MLKRYKGTFFNTLMLYLLTAAKTIFPLITLPYLSRVLSVDCYGVVSYVKAVMSYVQITVDFGFLFSAVKEIVETEGNKRRISEIIGETIVSKLLLSAVAFLVIVILGLNIDILRKNFLFLILSTLVPVLSSFLMDFLFRGIEKMHIITFIFVIMKTVSTFLTIILIKGDTDVNLIPIFDIISSLIAIIISWIFVKKLGYGFKFTNLKNCLLKIKISFGYFANSVASSAFGTLNTVLMGIFMKDTAQIAYWSVCMQMVGAVQNMYVPISNGIYPYMIKNKDTKLIKKIMLIFMPLILIGSGFCYILSPEILGIVAGQNYIGAAYIFRLLLPVVILSFPVAILGWPSLGAIGKIKEVTYSTLVGAVIQVLGLLLLALAGKFTLISLALLRSFSELSMLILRGYYFIKNKKEFNTISLKNE